jgi:hypothetical protein
MRKMTRAELDNLLAKLDRKIEGKINAGMTANVNQILVNRRTLIACFIRQRPALKLYPCPMCGYPTSPSSPMVYLPPCGPTDGLCAGCASDSDDYEGQRDEDQPDYGGVLGADGQVYSDADPGL